MLGGDRPFMVTTHSDSRDESSTQPYSSDQQNRRYHGSYFSSYGQWKRGGGYGKPSPRSGYKDSHRTASGLVGRITSISRSSYPHQGHTSGSHQSVPHHETFSGPHGHGREYTITSSHQQNWQQYYSHGSGTQTGRQSHRQQDNVQSVK